jgi:heptosyltransferase I
MPRHRLPRPDRHLRTAHHGRRTARRTARRGRFDLVVNAQRYFKGLFPALFAGAPVRLGLARDKTRDGVSFFNTHHLPNGPWQHTQDIFLSFLPALGLARPERLEWGLTFSEAEESSVREYFAGHPDHCVGVVVGTANPRKDWPVEHYIRLVEAISDRFGLSVFLLGGPSDRERAAADAILTGVPGTHPPVDALTGSVRELMWKIRGMRFIISPDTAPVHIARAMEIPVIGLYGHTNPARVGPYRAFGDLVVDRYTEPGGAPDPAGYAPRQDRMALITPEDVLEKVSVLV